MTRILHVMRKELIELRSDPRLFGIAIMAPLVQLGVLGYAATTDVRNVPTLVVDADRSTASRELIARFEASDTFTVVGLEDSSDAIDAWLDSGDAWMALSIPAGYGRHVESRRPATLQVIADGTDSNSTTVALSYAQALVNEYAVELHARQGGASAAPVSAAIRVWFNPRLESRDFIIPGIMALLLLVVTTNLSSMALVREREVGTLEQLNVTPIGRFELILGKLLPYAAIGLIDVVLVLMVSIYWFEVPMRGSVALLFAMCALYLLCTLGLGLFVSSISHTQQQAMMTSVFFFMIPMIYLSGFVFPIENMPDWVQAITYLIPLRYFLVIVRGIFLKGVGLDVLWPQAVALFAWGTVVLTLAALRSSKRLS